MGAGNYYLFGLWTDIFHLMCHSTMQQPLIQHIYHILESNTPPHFSWADILDTNLNSIMLSYHVINFKVKSHMIRWVDHVDMCLLPHVHQHIIGTLAWDNINVRFRMSKSITEQGLKCRHLEEALKKKNMKYIAIDVDSIKEALLVMHS